ncbi:hypothetical protein EVAR_741_1 [Eumeta japonica]|uniref:Uncharacterized protein n=1 Tax=Eumeta variegata TaxID=151549 RepID=A0A4C1SCN0_EUMVA|nr:hypothetical protein EVAR_741_1 [Eumeta japonica]
MKIPLASSLESCGGAPCAVTVTEIFGDPLPSISPSPLPTISAIPAPCRQPVPTPLVHSFLHQISYCEYFYTRGRQRIGARIQLKRSGAINNGSSIPVGLALTRSNENAGALASFCENLRGSPEVVRRHEIQTVKKSTSQSGTTDRQALRQGIEGTGLSRRVGIRLRRGTGEVRSFERARGRPPSWDSPEPATTSRGAVVLA